MEAKSLQPDSGGMGSFGKSLVLIALIFFMFFVALAVCAYFSCDAAEMIVVFVLVAVLWQQREGVKKKVLVWFYIFRKRPHIVIVPGILLGAAIAAAKAMWLRYALSIVAFSVFISLYAIEREEMRMNKILMEREQDGYLPDEQK